MESAQLDSSTTASRLAMARAMLNPKQVVEPVWPVLMAAALFMFSAMGLSVAALFAPAPSIGAAQNQ